MRLGSPQALLVDHPGLVSPLDGVGGATVELDPAALGRTDRRRVATQMLALTALLASFELWVGRSALRRARIVEWPDGIGVELGGLPTSLSRVRAGLGGGEAAAAALRKAVLDEIAARSGDDEVVDAAAAGGPWFFLDDAVERLTATLPEPLDPLTGRSLWAWCWPLPSVPEPGAAELINSDRPTTSRRVGAAAWLSAARSGVSAQLEIVDGRGDPVVVGGRAARPALRVVAGDLDDRRLSALLDGSGDGGASLLVIGRLPEGWLPTLPPTYLRGAPERRLALTGASAANRATVIRHLGNGFDPASEGDRAALTTWARNRFAVTGARERSSPSTLETVAGLRPDGVPVETALELARADEEALRRLRDDGALVVRSGRVRLPVAVLMTADPRHARIARLEPEGSPKRLLHEALATGDAGPLMRWARHALDRLDGRSVRNLLMLVDGAALGFAVRTLLAEACLSVVDIAGAERALEGLPSDLAAPWRGWLDLLDRIPGRTVQSPSPAELEHAPRACAEIALIELRRAVEAGDARTSDLVDVIRRATQHLNGASRRWIEIRLTSRTRPELLDDRGWRRSMAGGHRELEGLILFERSIRAMIDGRPALARRLLRRVNRAEWSPGRKALIHVNLGYLEADRGRHDAAEALTAGAYRLFRAAGFRHRIWEPLFNLAVGDLDQLRVHLAEARLNELAGMEDSLWVRVEKARLELAKGELERLRDLLSELPDGDSAPTRDVAAAVSFLRGAERLLSGDVTAATQLLRAGDDEGRPWLALAAATVGEHPDPATIEDDGWGIAFAAELVPEMASAEGSVSDRMPEPAELEVRHALALAVADRMSPRSETMSSALRAAAARTAAATGLSGWARSLRRGGRRQESFYQRLSALLRDHGGTAATHHGLHAIVSELGAGGLVISSTVDGHELLRIGDGPPANGLIRGGIELTPLGVVDSSDPVWDLVADVVELARPMDRGEPTGGAESEVRIDGVSEAAQALRAEICRAATPGFPVLVLGETGAGKELVTREIHRLSGRTGRLVPVNIAAVPSQLIEAELFGSVKGAFTGATRARRGLVAAAEGGTLFLDEVGDLDVSLQVKLLRFLESGEVRAVGADRSRCVDVRVICATHRNLQRMVREGRFREDLYYRIAVIPVEVPPLRQRREDIPVLRTIFERELAARHAVRSGGWTAAADRQLMRHSWPGNVRELRHTVQVALARAGGDPIRPQHLPFAVDDAVSEGTWEQRLAEFRRRLLREVLGRHHGNRSAAARELGISRQALLYQINKLGLRDL